MLPNTFEKSAATVPFKETDGFTLQRDFLQTGHRPSAWRGWEIWGLKIATVRPALTFIGRAAALTKDSTWSFMLLERPGMDGIIQIREVG